MKPTPVFPVLPALLVLLLAAAVEGQTIAPLEVPELLESVDRAFPLLERARAEGDAAAGAALESRGAFDVRLKADASALNGYYSNDRFETGFDQPVALFGATLFGGYRVGRGDFAPYDEKTLTLSGGEWSAGVALPLLRNRAIDERRAGVRRADLGVEVVSQEVSRLRLQYFREALSAYWDWVAAGQQLDIVAALLDLAEQRDQDLATAVAVGQVAPIERTENQRAILNRRAALRLAQRAVEATAITLSLYYRASDGTPIRPPVERVPVNLPAPTPLGPGDELEALAEALQRRPELHGLQARQAQQQIETALARNSLLPKLELFADVSRDTGDGRPSRAGSDLAGGLSFELPLQRRRASGRQLQALAKLAGLDSERRFVTDRIRAEVQDAASALDAVYTTLDLVRQEVVLARDLEGLERDRFALGDSTLFLVNLRELNTADAAVREIKALADYQKARVALDAATGRLGDILPTATP